MKIFVRSFLTLLLTLFGLAFFLQTPLAKKQIKKALVLQALHHDVDLTIGNLDGNLPFDWTLKDVTASYRSNRVHIDSVTLRLSILPLFRKHAEVSHLKIQGGDYKGLPFEGIARGRIDWSFKKPIKISHFLIEGEELFIRMEGKIAKEGIIQEGTLAFNIPDLTYFHSDINAGSLMGTAQVTKQMAHFDCTAENLKLCQQPFKTSTFSFDAAPKNNIWVGTAMIDGGPIDIPLEGKGQFQFKPREKFLSIEDCKIHGPEVQLFGRIDLDASLKKFQGSLFAQCLDLRLLRPFYPDSYLKGKVGAKVDLQSYGKYQEFHCQLEVEDFGHQDLTFESFTAESTIYDLFGDLRGEFAIDGKNLKLPQMELADVEIKSTFDPHASPFDFTVRGNWKAPLLVSGSGSWQRRGGSGLFASIETLSGQAFNKPFSLRESFCLEWNPQQFKMSNFAMDIAGGYVTSRIDLTENSSLVKIKAKEFPLEFITLPHKHFSLAGYADVDIDIVSWEKRIQGNCNVALQRAFFVTEGSQQPLMTKGSLQIHLSDYVAQYHGDLKTKNAQFMEFSGSLPFTFEPYPFRFSLDTNSPFSGQLVAEGKLEDLLNFINIGHHRIEGWLSTKLLFSNTLRHPNLTGNLELQDGLYENYYTGTHLKEIQAKGSAHKQSILIETLRAVDGSGGTAIGSGQIALAPDQDFPFSISAVLHDIATVSFDTITGKFSGDITISGTKKVSTAKGRLKVVEATFRIPDQMPTALPELPIKFVNPPEIVTRRRLPPASSPLQLDLDLEVPKKAFVEGRGINAELKGELHLSGTYTDILANGTLQLVKGEYLFSGKVFDLKQGELIFNDTPTPSSYISLIGNCDLPDVDVTIMLRGPLTTPTLSFQSSPQLSTSSILSLILFNKDVSEISAIQALQLAQTVLSLSGNSAPDILEKIRKTIGVDRLTIVTSDNDMRKTSLQIGKYLMSGVMLTLSQGTESRNVSVELDLKRGLRFQAELNEDYQRKFSLKWHHHY